MNKEYIIKRNFLFSDSLKAKFFAANFPKSWDLAKLNKPTHTDVKPVTTAKVNVSNSNTY